MYSFAFSIINSFHLGSFKASATVPTAVRHPDHLNKQVNPTPVSIIDIGATILDAAGIDPQEALSKDWPAYNSIVPAQSLMPVVAGKEERIRDYTFTECSNLWEMIQSEKWKYVRHLQYEEPGDAPEEFYDLEKDPNETVNLITDPAYKEAVKWCRDRREYVIDHTPAAQSRWAPLIGEQV